MMETLIEWWNPGWRLRFMAMSSLPGRRRAGLK
jgi:hypothetical protein